MRIVKKNKKELNELELFYSLTKKKNYKKAIKKEEVCEKKKEASIEQIHIPLISDFDRSRHNKGLFNVMAGSLTTFSSQNTYEFVQWNPSGKLAKLQARDSSAKTEKRSTYLSKTNTDVLNESHNKKKTESKAVSRNDKNDLLNARRKIVYTHHKWKKDTKASTAYHSNNSQEKYSTVSIKEAPASPHQAKNPLELKNRLGEASSFFNTYKYRYLDDIAKWKLPVKLLRKANLGEKKHEKNEKKNEKKDEAVLRLKQSRSLNCLHGKHSKRLFVNREERQHQNVKENEKLQMKAETMVLLPVQWKNQKMERIHVLKRAHTDGTVSPNRNLCYSADRALRYPLKQKYSIPHRALSKTISLNKLPSTLDLNLRNLKKEINSQTFTISKQFPENEQILLQRKSSEPSSATAIPGCTSSSRFYSPKREIKAWLSQNNILLTPNSPSSVDRRLKRELNSDFTGRQCYFACGSENKEKRSGNENVNGTISLSCSKADESMKRRKLRRRRKAKEKSSPFLEKLRWKQREKERLAKVNDNLNKLTGGILGRPEESFLWKKRQKKEVSQIQFTKKAVDDCQRILENTMVKIKPSEFTGLSNRLHLEKKKLISSARVFKSHFL